MATDEEVFYKIARNYFGGLTFYSPDRTIEIIRGCMAEARNEGAKDGKHRLKSMKLSGEAFSTVCYHKHNKEQLDLCNCLDIERQAENNGALAERKKCLQIAKELGVYETFNARVTEKEG